MTESGPDRSAPAILIAEDNEADYLLLLRQVTRIFSSARCSRVAARAELVAALARQWDLIITDYHLSDIEEKELLDIIALSQPGTPCLVLSGSTYELRDIAVPENVFRILEKGDHSGLKTALNNSWRRSADGLF